MRFLRHPLVKDMVQVALLMGCGDIMAQTLVEKKEVREINWPRTAKFAGIGFAFVAPVLGKWYGVMERIVAKDQPKMQRAVKKMALDQFCFAPFFIVSLTTLVNLLNGMSMENNVQSLQEKFIPILTANYTVWPIVQMINFGLLPLQYQVVFAQTVALFWNTYLSLKINEK